MKRPLLLLAFALSALACDEEKRKADLLDATKPAEPAPPPPMPSASASAAAEATKPKEPIVCPEGNVVKINSPELEAEIRKKIAKPADKGALDANDLAKVTSVNLTSVTVDDLDPCTYPKLTGLKFLYLGKGKLSDLRPIQTLTRLEGLRASINEVEDLKPLEKLTKLDQLDLSKTHVRDISVLANLVNVTELQLDDTQVSDLSPLAKMKKLEHLSIQHTNVTDVSALQGLPKLKQLDVAGCAISNINVIKSNVRIVTTPVTSSK